MKLTAPSKKFLIAWTILMFVWLLILVHGAHAIPITGYPVGGSIGSGPCGWTDPNPHVFSKIGVGVAGIAGIAGLFAVPGAAIAAVLIGGLSGIWEGVLAMSSC